ncbi:MBG domain-containing protein, partial [Holdemanella biformis]
TVKYDVAREAGENVGKYTITPSGKAEQGNYSVTYATGTLTITKAETMTLTPELTGKNAEKVYDSKPLSGGAKATVTEGTTITYSTDGGKTWSETLPSITNVGTLNVKAKAVNKNYEDATVEYTLKVTRKAVTVTANDKTKVFGEKDPKLTATVAGTLGEDTVKYDVAREAGENVGKYTITPSGKAEQGNYSVTYATGTLTITRQSIDPGTDPEKPNPDYTGAKVNSPKDEVYDGKEHKWIPTVTDKADKKLKAGTDYTVEYSTKNFKDVGTIDVTITGIGNYTGTVTRTYKITPKSVTVTADNKTKVFGEKDPELTATVTGTIGKDTVEYTLSRKAGEDVGTYTITPSGKAEQTNYKVTYATGTLTITSQSIDPGTDPEKPDPDYTGAKVNSPKDEVYDGKEHKWIPTVTDKADKKLKAGTDYTVEYSTSDFTNVGTIEVVIKGKGNYTGTVTRTYKITPKSVTVTADNKSKVFGEKDPEWTATVDGTLGNDTVDYTLTREAGEAAGKYEITVKGDKLQGNYTVTYATGTLTITRQSIDPGTDPEKPNPDYTGAKVNSPKDEVYDGKEHKWIPTVTDKADKKLKAGTDYTVEYSTSDFTNVGTIKVTITGKGNYTGTVKRSYKVTPKEYTVTTESATKTYSGTALTAGGKVSGIVKGETVDFTITGSQTSVGTSDNTYELDWTGSAKESNYKHGKDSIGTLTVKAKSIVPDGPDTPDEKKTGITVSDPSDSKYDGKEHREVLTVQDTKKNDELVAEKDYSVTYSDDLVNAGTVTITIEGIGNYTGSFTKTYEITKRSVTLTSATASKTYDGQALTSTSITVSGDGFVKGEGATYNVTGTQTEVGNSANSFEYKLNENTLASNYDITKVVGTLTITAAPAPVIPAPTPRTPSTTPRTPSAPQVTTPAETVEKETTPKAEPKKEEKVEEEYTPKASPQYYWALINLICAIVTVLFGLLLLISKRHKDEDDEEEDDETKQQATTNEDEEQEQEKKRGLFTRVLAVLIAIVSVVFFLVTEDMSLAWTWTDQWTIWMVVIGLVQIVVFFVGRKWKNVDNDDDDEEAQQA